MKKILFFTFSIIFLLVLFSCHEPYKWDDVSLYFVTFDSKGGNINGSTEPMKVWVYETKSIEYPPIPQKTGFIFNGWFSEADGNGTLFNNKTKVFSDVEVFANWIVE
jgi:uncharacterized repeat protein (TIGR02543 family)